MIQRRPRKKDAEECYERLREEALHGVPGMRRGHGLALFLRRGMAGWLEVWEVFKPHAPRRELGSGQPRAVGLPVASRGEVATVMAQMILACAGEPA